MLLKEGLCYEELGALVALEIVRFLLCGQFKQVLVCLQCFLFVPDFFAEQ